MWSSLILWGAVWETVLLRSASGLKTTDLICRPYSLSTGRLLFKQNIKWAVRGKRRCFLASEKTTPGWKGFQAKKSFITEDCSSYKVQSSRRCCDDSFCSSGREAGCWLVLHLQINVWKPGQLTVALKSTSGASEKVFPSVTLVRQQIRMKWKMY